MTRGDTYDMSQEAHNFSPSDTVDMTGLEDLFSCHDKPRHEDLTLDEAAKRLNISGRSVQRRLKNGELFGYKIESPRGPEWRIRFGDFIESTQDTKTSSGDVTASAEDTIIVTESSSEDNTSSSGDTTDAEAVDNHDATGDTNVAVLAFTQLTGFYKDEIASLQNKLEAATYRNGYLEAQLVNAETQLKLLPDLSAKATKAESLEEQISRLESELQTARKTWWQRFGAWLVGKRTDSANNHSKAAAHNLRYVSPQSPFHGALWTFDVDNGLLGHALPPRSRLPETLG